MLENFFQELDISRNIIPKIMFGVGAVTITDTAPIGKGSSGGKQKSIKKIYQKMFKKP